MNLIQENVIQISGGITINVDVSVVKIILGILVNVVLKIENI